MDWNYKGMIIELISRIDNNEILKRIYNFVSRLYLKTL